MAAGAGLDDTSLRLLVLDLLAAQPNKRAPLADLDITNAIVAEAGKVAVRLARTGASARPRPLLPALLPPAVRPRKQRSPRSRRL